MQRRVAPVSRPASRTRDRPLRLAAYRPLTADQSSGDGANFVGEVDILGEALGECLQALAGRELEELSHAAPGR